jgi:peptidoglycan/xylan/chitin deacetylase (PgdA/CDA1 family)
MRIPGLKTLQLSGRWLKSRFVERVLILGYHRIAEVQHDPYSLCVSPRHFEEHLKILQKLTNPISLQELVHTLENGNLPSRPVVVTFDDGYADNLNHAKPLLDRYRIPATVFMVTGNMGRMFWWDELKHSLLSPQGLPERLKISFNDFTFEWGFRKSDFENSANDGFRHKELLLWTLYKKLLSMSYEERNKVIAYLCDWSNFKPKGSSPCRAMTADEIVELVSGGLIDVGAHTVSHPVLSELAAAEQRSEIMQSKKILEKILKGKLKSFSYPHGFPSKETIAIVRDSGFTCACASHNDVAWRRSDCFQLPRFWVQEWDDEKFSKWLMKWL